MGGIRDKWAAGGVRPGIASGPGTTRAGLVLALVLLVSACAQPEPRLIRSGADMPPSAFTFPDLPPEVDTPPRLVGGRAPVYPISKTLRGPGGSATISFTIGVDGRTADIEILEATEEVFARHLVAAARKWRFEPARDGATAVPVRVAFTQVFVAPRDDVIRARP